MIFRFVQCIPCGSLCNLIGRHRFFGICPLLFGCVGYGSVDIYGVVCFVCDVYLRVLKSFVMNLVCLPTYVNEVIFSWFFVAWSLDCLMLTFCFLCVVCFPMNVSSMFGLNLLLCRICLMVCILFLCLCRLVYIVCLGIRNSFFLF